MPTFTYLQEPLGRLNGSSFEKYVHLNFSKSAWASFISWAVTWCITKQQQRSKIWSRLDEEGENLIPSHWRFANDHDAFPCNMRGRRYDSWWLHSQVWSAGFIWISECSLNVWWRWRRIDASHKWAKRSGKQNDELMETYKQLKDGSTHERRKNWWANHQRSPEGNSHSAKIHLAFMPLRRSKLDVLFM